MRKLLISSFSIFLAAILLFQTSCKKDEVAATNNTPCPTATYPISGLWTGTYSSNSSLGTASFYSLTIYPDGTILTKGLISPGNYGYGTGTWTLNGNTFSATTSNMAVLPGDVITQSMTATFSNTGTLTNATWHDTVNRWGLQSGILSNVVRIN